MNIEEAIEKEHLKKITPDRELMKKELEEAKYDLKKAKETLEKKDYKWSTIQSYYVMFHSAKSFLYSLGYRENTHLGIIIVLEEQSLEGELESRYVNDYKAAKNARENADYNYSYSSEKAKYLVKTAEEFKKRIEEIVKKKEE